MNGRKKNPPRTIFQLVQIYFYTWKWKTKISKSQKILRFTIKNYLYKD